MELSNNLSNAVLHESPRRGTVGLFFYVSRGRLEGQALEHWNEAENQLAEYQHCSNANTGTTGYSASLQFSAEPQA